MAGTVRGITVEIGGDTSKLGKALENSEKKSRALQKELKQVNTALKFNPNNVELLTQKQKVLTEQIQATKEKLDTLKAAESQVEAQFNAGKIGEEQFRAFQREIIETESKLKSYESALEETAQQASALENLTDAISEQEQEVEQLKNEWKNAVLTYGANSDEAQKLASQIDSLSTELNENKTKMSDLDRAADQLDNSLDEVDDSARKAGDGFTVMKGVMADLASQAIQKVVSGFKDLAKETFQVGMDFEKSMSNNAALFGATGEELEKLSETAQHYGATTQFSASQAADALGYMALAGWDVNKAVDELPGVLNLAAASGMDLAQASDMVTDYLSAFSNTAMDATQFSDKLAYAQKNSNTTAQQLGEAFKNCAANLNASGQDVETVTSLLSAMANQGLKGSEAGTALSAVMRDLTKSMKDGKVQIGNASVAVQDAQGNYRDLTDILSDVEAATTGMGDAERAAALGATFTSDSIKGLNLILNEGTGSIADFETGLRNCDGAAGDMAAVMNDNVAGALATLKSNVESKMITVFDNAKGSIKTAIEQLSTSLDQIDWEAVGTAVGNFSEKVVGVFQWILDHWAGISIGLGAVGAVLGTVFVVDKVDKFAKSIGTLKTGFDNLFKVLAAPGLGPAILSVAGLTGGLVLMNIARENAIKKVTGLTDEEQKLIDKINAEKDAYQNAEATRKSQNQAIEAETAFTQNLWSELQTLVDENGKVKDGYEDRAAVITGQLSEAVGIDIEMVNGQITKYGELKASIDDIITAKRTEALLEVNKEAYVDAINNQAGAYANYTAAVADAAETEAELATAEANLDTIRDTINNSHLPKTSAMYTGLNQALLDQQEIVDGLKETYATQTQAVEDASETYLGYCNTIESYEGVLSAAASGDADAVSAALDRMSYGFKTAKNSTRDMLENQLDDFKQQYADMQAAVDQGMPGVTQAQVDAIGELVNAAQVELDKFDGVYVEEGTEAGEAFGEGLAGAGKEGAATAGKVIADAAMLGLESADTESVGAAEGSEFAEGIESTSGDAEAAGENLSKTAASGMENGDTKKVGTGKGTQYSEGITSTNNKAYSAGKGLTSNAQSGSSALSLTGSGGARGAEFVSGINNKKSDAYSAGSSLASNAKSGAESVSFWQSGVNLALGFINGIGSKLQSAWDKAYELAKKAINGLKAGQNEGSPSKLTFKSGEFFGEGFINGISSKAKQVIETARAMAEGAVDALADSDLSGALASTMSPFDDARLTTQFESHFGDVATHPDLSGLFERLTAIETAVKTSQRAIVLDSGALVGSTVNQTDAALSGVYRMRARGI